MLPQASGTVHAKKNGAARHWTAPSYLSAVCMCQAAFLAPVARLAASLAKLLTVA